MRPSTRLGPARTREPHSTSSGVRQSTTEETYATVLPPFADYLASTSTGVRGGCQPRAGKLPPRHRHDHRAGGDSPDSVGASGLRRPPRLARGSPSDVRPPFSRGSSTIFDGVETPPTSPPQPCREPRGHTLRERGASSEVTTVVADGITWPRSPRGMASFVVSVRSTETP